ncbi:MAG: alpha/beta hydrolase [Oscillospiraceae bacterium]|nr:alpha/beta hydrolase [Oscillospiraceae bacterium]
MNVRRFISLILCVVLLSAALALPAQAMQPCNCDNLPIVWIEGFGQPLLMNEGTRRESAQRPADIGRVVSSLPALGRGAWGTVRSINLRRSSIDFTPLADGIVDMLFGAMGHLQLDETGQSIAPLTPNQRINPRQDYRRQRQFDFIQDYRLCPFESASQLNVFIEALVEHTGHEQVVISTHSQGGIVALTYIAQYGHDRVATLVMNESAFQGVSLATAVLLGDLSMAPQDLVNFMRNPNGGLGNLLVNAMDAMWWFDWLPSVESFLEATVMDTLIEDFMMPMFGQFPSVWAFVPPEDFDRVARHHANNPDFAHLIAGARRYRNQVQLRAETLLRRAMDDGMHLALIASHGTASIPFASGAPGLHGDGMIETVRASGGATVAPFGEVLPASDSRYRSPCGVIDASTAMFPDYTWFVRNNSHSFEAMRNLVAWLIDQPEQPTVWQSPQFPQFMVVPARGFNPQVRPDR